MIPMGDPDPDKAFYYETVNDKRWVFRGTLMRRAILGKRQLRRAELRMHGLRNEA